MATPENTGERTAAALFSAYVDFMKLMLGNLFILSSGSATAVIALLGTRPKDSATVLSEQGVRCAVVFFGIAAAFAVISAGLLAWQENRNADRVEKFGREERNRRPRFYSPENAVQPAASPTLEFKLGAAGVICMALSGAALALGYLLAVATPDKTGHGIRVLSIGAPTCLCSAAQTTPPAPS